MLSFFKIHPIKLLVLSNFALLIFILNIPGTIALRNLLAVVLLVTLALIFLKSETSIKLLFNSKHFSNLTLILLTLTIYIFFHSVFKADEIEWSLSQYRTQWIYPMLYFIMGSLLAFLAASNQYFNNKTLLTVLFSSLFVHVLYIDLIAIIEYFETGQLLTRFGGLTKSPVLGNYITNILNSMIIVEFIYRFRMKEKVLPFNSYFLFLFLLLCVLSSIIEGMRFGVISLFFMSLTGAIFFIIDNPKYNLKVKSCIALSLVILCSLPLLYNVKYDSRWDSLIETIPIALDTENNVFWQVKDATWREGNNSAIGSLANGVQLDHSNYMRIAWAAKGVEYISKDIYGIGYGRNVFGHAIAKYDDNDSIRGWHSHSGIVDFTIGVGLIGLLLWISFISSVIFHGTSVFINKGNYFALLSVFISSGFFIRSVVDSNMRDHMFKQFFLILGITLVLAFYEKNKKQEAL